MALHSLDLGQLGLVSTTSGLQVQVTSSVQLAAAEECQDSLRMPDVFASYGVNQIWTTLAAEFHFAIELHLPGDALTYRYDLAETLAQTLFDSQVPIYRNTYRYRLLTVDSFGSNCSLSPRPK